MVSNVHGCNISLFFGANELTSHDYVYILPTGYSINTIYISKASNIIVLNDIAVKSDTRYTFPPINSKSPSTISFYVQDLTKPTEIRFVIEKFGQIPDPHYFDKAFEPILVVGDDGNEYNVIPSDQFK